MKKIDLDGALLWLGFGRGVRVVGSGDFSRFPAALGCFSGLQGGYLRCSKPEDSTRVDLKPKMKKIDLDGALLWLGFGRGVRGCW